MTLLPHMAARIFGAPLLIHRPKLEVILAVLGPRIGLSESGTPIPVPATRSPPTTDGGIAVLPIYGTLVRRAVGLEAASGLTSYQDIATQLDAAIADPSVAAIVLDIKRRVFNSRKRRAAGDGLRCCSSHAASA